MILMFSNLLKSTRQLLVITFVFTIVFLSVPLTAHSASEDFVNVFGGSDDDQFTSVDKTSDGGYIAAGHSYSIDKDLMGLSKGSYDAVIVKYDPKLNKQWVKIFGGTNIDEFSCVKQTKDGGYIAAGYSLSTDGNMSGLTNSKLDNLNYDAVIVKYDSKGTVEWVKAVGGTGADYIQSVEQTSDGSYIAVGRTDSKEGDFLNLNKGTNFTDAFIVKFSSNGNKLWVKTFGGTWSDEFNFVKRTNDGGFIAAGLTNSNDVDLTGERGIYGLLVKYSSEGNVVWSKKLNTTDLKLAVYMYAGFMSVDQTRDGGYIAVGLNLYSLNSLTAEKALIVKCDSNGNEEWRKILAIGEHTGLSSVIQTSDGGFAACGYSWSSDPNRRGYIKDGGIESFVVKYTSDGTQQWLKSDERFNRGKFKSLQETKDGYVTAGFAEFSTEKSLGLSKGFFDGVIYKFDPNNKKNYSSTIKDAEAKLAAEKKALEDKAAALRDKAELEAWDAGQRAFFNSMGKFTSSSSSTAVNKLDLAVELVKLSGAEKEVLQNKANYSKLCTFTDVSASYKHYVGYCYSKGWISGSSSKQFGVKDKATVNTLVKSILKATSKTISYSNIMEVISSLSASDMNKASINAMLNRAKALK